MLTKRALLAGMAATGFGLADAGPAWAQIYPTRPVKMVVPLPPGSAPDVRHRLIAQALTQLWARQVIVENCPGGGGLVTSLARPGGNATGVNIFTTELVEKRLGLLRDLVPAATTVAVLSNPNFPAAVANVRESEAAARAIGKEVVIFNASSDAEIETAFVNILRTRPGALLVGADPFFNSRRGLIVALAARHAIPAIYEWREFAEAGGLISYGTSLVEAYRQQGIYTGRILKGEKPADLPVVQLSKFELVINLNTGKALGLVIPPSVLALADEVIE
jgi:putative tryptophan/tyrosine transport system substrate-binding protein